MASLSGIPAPDPASADLGLLPYLDQQRIFDFYRLSPGRELDGKFQHPESSAALVANAFGFFLDRGEPLLDALELNSQGPAVVTLEQCLRFPWNGGLHPWLDAVIETPGAIIAIESKRYEPFRGSKRGGFSDAYLRPVWGEGMGRFMAQRDALMAGEGGYVHLDATQLVKHSLGLATEARRRRKRPFLIYLHAEPTAWPNGKPIVASKIIDHRAERDRFATSVAGDFVTFRTIDYATLLAALARSTDQSVQMHAQAVAARFAPL